MANNPASEAPSSNSDASPASGRGRPAYAPSEKDRRIAEALSGWAIPQHRIASVIGCDAKTLRKHFGTELKVGGAKLEAQLAQNLLRIASGQDRQALIATIFALKSRFGWVEAVAPSQAKEPKLGKKEAAELAALTAGEGTDWGEDLLSPPSPLLA
jgi:hypothetical protein